MSVPDLVRPARAVAVAALILAGFGADQGGAAVLTAGAGGTYATIQAAIDAARGTAAPDEIRVRAGSYSAHLATGSFSDDNDLEISGGWDAAFATRNPSPSSTTIDGSGTGRVLHVSDMLGWKLVLRGLTLQHGLGDQNGGGGFLAKAYSGSAIRIERCVFADNEIESADTGQGAPGGGVSILATDSSTLTIVDSEIRGNTATITGGGGSARGGGGAIFVSGNATAVVRRTMVEDNVLAGGAFHSGGGLLFQTYDDATLTVEDSTFVLNHGGLSAEGSGFAVIANGSSSADIRRIVALENFLGSDASTQVELRANDTAFARLSDSLIANGEAGLNGIAIPGTLRLINLTVAEHTGTGIELYRESDSELSLSNSISFGNGDDLFTSGSSIDQEANRIGSEPGFVDGAAGDYRLSAVSDAANAGTSTPAGGLSALDLDHAPRSVGAAPDQGAYERDAIFGDGFETGDTSWWSGS